MTAISKMSGNYPQIIGMSGKTAHYTVTQRNKYQVRTLSQRRSTVSRDPDLLFQLHDI